MYAKCGSPDNATQVFTQMKRKNLITWSAMVSAFADHGHCKEALHHFRSMQQEGILPNGITFISLLNSFTSSSDLVELSPIHRLIREQGLESNIAMGNALVNVYGKCESPDDARLMFDRLKHPNIISWNSMIGIYVDCERNNEALQLFRKMQLQGMQPDKVNFMTVLGACSDPSQRSVRRLMHEWVIESGLGSSPQVQTCLVNMYAKAGELDVAAMVFWQIEEPQATAWNVLIAGYALHGRSNEALQTYRKLLLEALGVDKVTLISILSACTSSTLLAEGKAIHLNAVESGADTDVIVKNALINMYSKCGSMENARKFFDSMAFRNSSSWNSMIQAYTQHGQSEDVLKLVKRMEQDGSNLNDVTLISVLSSCSHAGLLAEGLRYFHSLIHDRNMEPRIEHYGCLVDLLGRAGKLEEAEKYIAKMSSDPGIVTWASFLGACRVHKDLERGTLAAKKVLELDPLNSSACVVMSNMYEESEKVVRRQRWKTSVLQEQCL